MHPLTAHMTLAPISSSLAERLLAPRTTIGWMMCQEANKREEFFANCKSVLDLSAKSRRYRITTAPGLFILIAEPYCPMRSSRLAWLTPTASIVFHLKSFHSYVSAADRALIQMRLGSEIALLVTLVVLSGFVATGLLALFFLK